MLLLIAGLALWFVAHGLKIHAPAARAGLVGRIGEGGVKGVVALALVGSVALMVRGYGAAEYVALWTPPLWIVHLNNLLMVLAVAVYVAAPFPGHVRAWIRHPQLTGVKIWAVAHLLVNGDLASAVLFGGLLAWAVAAMVGINRRDSKRSTPAAGGLGGDALHAAVALALVAGIGWVHTWLGIWPFASSPPA